MEGFLPRQTEAVEQIHEWIWIEFLDIEHARTFPFTAEHQRSTDHGRDASGVGNGLTANFPIASFVVTDVVEIVLLGLPVLDTLENTADVGLAFGAWSQRSRIGENGFEKLQRNNLFSFEEDGLNRGHADVFQALEVGEVALAKRHEEADAANAPQVETQRFELFVVEEIHVFLSHFWEIVASFDLHGFGFDPLAVFPVTAFGGDFADIDFGVEVCGEGVAVVTGVAVEDVEVVYFVEMVFLGVGGEYTGDSGVEATSEDGGETGFLEAFPVGPLPFVFEFGCVEGFVVCGVHIVYAGFETGIHDGEILIGEGEIKDEFRLEIADEGDQFGDLVGIDFGRVDAGFRPFGLDGLFEGVATGEGAAGDADLAEYLGVLCAFVGGDLGDATGADDENFAHEKPPDFGFAGFRRLYESCWSAKCGFAGSCVSGAPKALRLRGLTLVRGSPLCGRYWIAVLRQDEEQFT